MTTPLYVDIDALTDKFSRRIIEAVSGLDKFGGDVQKIDKKLKKFNGAEMLAGGALAAASAAITAAVAIGRLEDKYQSVLIPLQNVTREHGDFEQSLRVVDSIANSTGQNNLLLADTYKSIYASAKQAGFATDDINKIFASVTRSGAAMKLSNEQVSMSLKAVEQMMNKGTISSEELRQQLGDHIPGAYALMAKAAKDAGLSTNGTTAELGKLLETGALASKEVLPFFAQRLEEAFGKDAARNLETISGSANRMKNELSELVIALDDSKVSRFWANMQNGIADSLRGLKHLVKSNEWESIIGVMFGNAKSAIRAASVINFEEGLSKQYEKFLTSGKDDQLKILEATNKQLQEFKDVMRIEPLLPGNSIEDNAKVVTSLANHLIQLSNIYKGVSTDGVSAIKELTSEQKSLFNEIGKLRIDAIYGDSLDKANQRVISAYELEKEGYLQLLKDKKITLSNFDEWVKAREKVLQLDLLDVRKSYWNSIKLLDKKSAEDTAYSSQMALVKGISDVLGLDINFEGIGERMKSHIGNIMSSMTEIDVDTPLSAFLQKFTQKVETMREVMQNAIAMGMSFVADTLAIGLASIFNPDVKFDFKALLGRFLSGLGDMLIQMAVQLKAAAIAKTATEGALTTFGGGIAAIGGAGTLLALGIAAKTGGAALSASAPSSSVGGGYNQGGYGSGYGTTFSPNITATFGGTVQVVADGTQLKGVLDSTNVRYNG